MLVWIDVERALPAKIVIRNPDPKHPIEFRLEEFAWNEPLCPSLFSLAIPEGFQRGVVAEIPSPKKPSPASPTPPDNPNYPADGVLSRDRVPARIVWGAEGRTLTALMREPESVPPLERQEHELRQWDVATGKLRWSVPIGGAGWLAATAASERLAIVIGYEIQLRDAASGTVTRTWATDKPLSPIAFSPDGKTLAAGITEWGRHGGKGGKQSGGIQFWDIERACLVRSIADDKLVTFTRYSVDGKHLATSSNDAVKLWDVATGELTRIFPARVPVDFSADGQTIACVSIAPRDDKTVGRVDLYDLRKGSLVKSFVSEKGATASWLLSVAFSPDGRLLVASDWNGTVTLWDVATGERKQTITDHQAGVLSVAFAPNGEMLATGSEDKTLRLRKLPAGLTQPVPEKR
jgi:dipeptidyl aminopeptidase/acylaminoacyl peptidase